MSAAASTPPRCWPGPGRQRWRSSMSLPTTPTTGRRSTAAIADLVSRVGMELRQRRQEARRVGIWVRYADGLQVVRQATARRRTASDFQLRQLADQALARAWLRRGRLRSCRLVCDDLRRQSPQLPLFAEPPRPGAAAGRIAGGDGHHPQPFRPYPDRHRPAAFVAAPACGRRGRLRPATAGLPRPSPCFLSVSVLPTPCSKALRSPAALCRLARQHGYPGLALTDGDNLYGLWPFLAACRREGLRPMVGAEVSEPGSTRRVTCLVEDEGGYANLCRSAEPAPRYRRLRSRRRPCGREPGADHPWRDLPLLQELWEAGLETGRRSRPAADRSRPPAQKLGPQTGA